MNKTIKPSTRKEVNRGQDGSSGAEPVAVYHSLAQAIADGALIDVGALAREAGFRHPVIVTRAAWDRYVRVPEGVTGQDEQGRLWDVLMMLHFAIRRSPDAERILHFSLLVNNDDARGPEPVTLKALCGPGDTPEPVIVVMTTSED